METDLQPRFMARTVADEIRNENKRERIQLEQTKSLPSLVKDLLRAIR